MAENPDTWYRRDLPVLREVVRHFDESPGRHFRLAEITQAVNTDSDGESWDDATIGRALAVLERNALLTMFWTERVGGRRIAGVSEIAGKAHRLVGAWPTPESGADRLIAALERIAENTDDADERGRAQRVLEAFAGSGRQIAVGVATAIATGQLT